MKKLLAVFMILICTFSLIACEGLGKRNDTAVELEVVTTYAGQDGGVDAYRNACAMWEEKTGNIVVDMSMNSDESFKARVNTDFETGSEPDVLFYFTGADANSFVAENKVVSIEEIREVYPEFAGNINEECIPTSLVDGKKYAVPSVGYWEGLLVNKKVLEAAGVEVPGADYTWEQFLDDCDKIKQAGYIPIAAALGDVPHYWWEYTILNHTGTDRHLQIPNSVEEELGQDWVQGIEDIKLLYEYGYFPVNTLSVTNEEVFSVFMEDKAAFLVDGSWRIGGIIKACQSDPEDESTLDLEKLSNYVVTYFPGTEERPATEIIGGFSMGYYITRKAWEDPQKREAAINFITYMTSDEVVPDFSVHTTNALKEPVVIEEENYNSLQLSAIQMLQGKTDLVSAVQDYYEGECRISTFDGMPEIVTGKVVSLEAVQERLDIYNNAQK